jgi:alkyl sulfatase BDS1-like metallo-beta-lactamase superfamily hydrolase
MYRWLHDQTMRRANHGMTMREIAEDLELPPCFAKHGHTRGYYGTVSHNSKAVYQRYLGWYDSNPANLHPHTPENSGARYVECLGGAERVLELAREAFDRGDYRWVSELLNHLVFAEPNNEPARLLQADSFEQLAYQSESGPWRDSYLMGAMELRTGSKGLGLGPRAITDDLDVEMLVELIGVRLIADRVLDVQVSMNWHFSDVGEDHVIGVDNCAINHRAHRRIGDADCNLTTTKARLASLLNGELGLDGFLAADDVVVDHERPVRTLLGSLDRFSSIFGIVEP